MKKTKSEKKPKALWRSVVFALCLLFFDAFVLDQGGLAVITAIVVVFWFIPKTLFAWKRKQNFIIWAKKIIVYSVMVATIFTVKAINNNLAKTRAEQLIIAINKFKVINRRYPSTLNELVPKLITEIPKAKYTFWFNSFEYTNMEGFTTLLYTDFPPFGRPYYDFDKQEWRYID